MNILVVDDNSANRKLLNTYLTVQGFSVHEADNGEEAIELFSETQPDLVLMDVMMPGIGGYEASKTIKSDSSDVYVPIIYVTALKPEDAMKEALVAGGDDFVTKPINFEILISKINAHLRIRESSFKLAQANAQLTEYNQRLVRENDLVEHIFNNALKKSYFDDSFIQYHLSPMSAFNGDVLLSEKKPNGNVCVLVGDFTGHGLSAAIGTLPIIKVFFTMVRKGLGLEEIAKELNDTIKLLLPVNIFLCASLIELNGESKKISYWSGGLPPMLLHDHRNNTVDQILSSHMPFGILPNKKFISDITDIEVSDNQKLYIYTDGIIEARNQAGEMYSLNRLLDVFSETDADAFNNIISQHQVFMGENQQDDDMTIIELSCDNLASQ